MISVETCLNLTHEVKAFIIAEIFPLAFGKIGASIFPSKCGTLEFGLNFDLIGGSCAFSWSVFVFDSALILNIIVEGQRSYLLPGAFAVHNIDFIMLCTSVYAEMVFKRCCSCLDIRLTLKIAAFR